MYPSILCKYIATFEQYTGWTFLDSYSPLRKIKAQSAKIVVTFPIQFHLVRENSLCKPDYLAR